MRHLKLRCLWIVTIISLLLDVVAVLCLFVWYDKHAALTNIGVSILLLFSIRKQVMGSD